MRARFVLFVIAFGFFLSFTAAAQQQNATALTLHVDEAGVQVKNLTPGGEVVLFSCSKYGRNGQAVVDARPRLLRDDDGDGIVTAAGPVPYVSVWVAVDWKSGALATGAREGVPLHVAPIAPELHRKDAAEQIIGLEQRILRLMLLLVRPGHGAWALRGREGGEGDSDKEANGRLQLTFEEAAPLAEGKEKAPKHLKTGDVLVAIDLGHLDIFTGVVTK